MSNAPRRRRWPWFVLILLLALLALFLLRCRPQTEAPPATGSSSDVGPSATAPDHPPVPGTPADNSIANDVLTPATLKVPAEVDAGAEFAVEWSGPNNRGDYVTIVVLAAPDGAYAHHRETRLGNPLNLTAPIEAGEYEVRYMTDRTRTVLGRAPIAVRATAATLNAPATVVAGKTIPVEWTGPNNHADYITVVPPDLPDGQFRNYTDAVKGSPLEVRAPMETGPAELRYMTGQGARVLARRPITIVPAEVSLSAPAEMIAGTQVEVVWTGPNNPSDYITIVPLNLPDGQYRNYTDTRAGSPLKITGLIDAGPAELRYMSGQGAQVLARRSILIRAAEITLSAPSEVPAGQQFTVDWTGPNNPSDYITVVPVALPEGQYRNYGDARTGSPLTLTAPAEPGDAELRYVSGQGSKTLARRPIRVVAP